MRLLIPFFLLTFCAILQIRAEDSTSISLTPAQIEGIFLAQNLELLAEQMNIGIAEAEVMQARLWENPEISISDLNLWSTRSQREEAGIPPLFGSFARNKQFSIELSQVIYTANKKAKEIRKEKVSKEIAVKEFESLLLNLRSELRDHIRETTFQQAYLQVLNTQFEVYNQLLEAYRKQVKSGNIARSELLRIEASALEMESEINETKLALNTCQKQLRVWLSIDSDMFIHIMDASDEIVAPCDILLGELLDNELENRPDLAKQKLQTHYYQQLLNWEKSKRVPDITFSVSYDRRGGVWNNYIGFGLGVTLPLFDRNQAAVKSAGIAREQSLFKEKQEVLTARQEVMECYKNYQEVYTFYIRINKNESINELDDMLEAYTRNIIKRHISLIEYIDFMEAYKANKLTRLNVEKKLHLAFEALQHAAGKDFKSKPL